MLGSQVERENENHNGSEKDSTRAKQRRPPGTQSERRLSPIQSGYLAPAIELGRPSMPKDCAAGPRPQANARLAAAHQLHHIRDDYNGHGYGDGAATDSS